MTISRAYVLKAPPQVPSIRLDVATIDYFKALALKDGIPYQTLMNMYLSDCASHGREPDLAWR